MTIRFAHLPRIAGMALVLLAAAPCGAQQADARPDQPARRAADQPIGDHTRTLLEIQRNGSQAGALQPLGGEQAALGYARYMQSFRHPLPEFFTSQATGSPLRGGAGSQAMPGQ